MKESSARRIKKNVKTGNRVVQNTFFLILFLFVSRDGFAQEEHHNQKHHRHLEYAKSKNPVAQTERSVAQGRELYEKHCRACHGTFGKGGIGPDLSAAVRIHGNTDGEMFHVISDGVKGTAMKGFRKELPDEMRWHLVNYLKSLIVKKDK
jgi:mono/diheme cytochrome c family protein